MRVELITIGDELLFGKTVDTNAAHMAEKLAGVGAEVVRVTTVGDSVGQIVEALLSGGRRADTVIATGGLGPTPDDVTRQAIAEAFGLKLVFDEDIFRNIEERWVRRGKRVPESARALALVPEGADVITNTVGAAAGLRIVYEGTLFFFLPGVPEEMRSMMENCILPSAEERAGGRAIRHRTLRTAGITESALHEKLKGIDAETPGIKIAYLPQTFEVHLRLTAHGESVEKAEHDISQAERVVRGRLEYYIYGVDDQSLEEVVGGLFSDRGATLSVAESCTGGLISGRLTDIPGSSGFFDRGVVVYSTRAKREMLSISNEMLEKHGTVSAEVARAMAEQVRSLGGTDVGLAVTGIMGPAGGTPERPVGLVYVGVAHAHGTFHKEFRFVGDRGTNRQWTAQAALNEVRLFLLRSSETGGERGDNLAIV